MKPGQSETHDHLPYVVARELIDACSRFWKKIRATLNGLNPKELQTIEESGHQLLTYALTPILLSPELSLKHLTNVTGLTEAQANIVIAAIKKLALQENVVELSSDKYTYPTLTKCLWYSVAVNEFESVLFCLILNARKKHLAGVKITVCQYSDHESEKKYTRLYLYPDDSTNNNGALLSQESEELADVESALRLLLAYNSRPVSGKVSVQRQGHTLIETVTYAPHSGKSTRTCVFDLLNPDPVHDTKIALYVGRLQQQ